VILSERHCSTKGAREVSRSKEEGPKLGGWKERELSSNRTFSTFPSRLLVIWRCPKLVDVADISGISTIWYREAVRLYLDSHPSLSFRHPSSCFCPFACLEADLGTRSSSHRSPKKSPTTSFRSQALKRQILACSYTSLPLSLSPLHFVQALVASSLIQIDFDSSLYLVQNLY